MRFTVFMQISRNRWQGKPEPGWRGRPRTELPDPLAGLMGQHFCRLCGASWPCPRLGPRKTCLAKKDIEKSGTVCAKCVKANPKKIGMNAAIQGPEIKEGGIA